MRPGGNMALLGALVFACGLASKARGQAASDLEPQWLRISMPPQMSLGMEAEGLMENVSINGVESRHERFSLIPLAGLKLDGSVYHPNLMSFSFDGEGGWGPAYDSNSGPGYSQSRNESESLQRYLAQVFFLQGKPYNFSFFAGKDHTFRDYDFFNTAIVDSSRYGGRGSWISGPWNLSLEAGRREESTSSLGGNSDFTDSYVTFNGLHQRGRGSTTVMYTYDEFTRLDYFTGSTGSSHNLNLSDTETFGARDQIIATTGGGYTLYDYGDQSNNNSWNLSENIEIEHQPNLKSYYRLNFDENQFDPASTTLFQGMAGLRHKLFENLRSDLDVHGSYQEFDGVGGQGMNSRYGVGLHEDYYRNITDSVKLSLGGSIVADHEDHESTGSVLSVIDERHTLLLAPPHPEYLNNPAVIRSSVTVRRADGLPLQQHVDYRLVPQGQLTEIQLVPTSVLLTSGGTVLVTYESESLYNSSFESLNSGVQVRLDLFKHFGVYARANWLDNNAPPNALVETLTDYVAGADVNWRWLRAGVEFENFTSTFTSYDALRLFESFSFRPEENSNLAFDFNQIFYRYPDGRDETQHQFIVRFDTRLKAWLTWNVEGGYFLHDIGGVTQDLAAARTGLNMGWGKLTVRTGYQYNYQLNQGIEERTRNFFYLYAKRVF